MEVSLQLQALKTWLAPISFTSWKEIEEALVHPVRLQDLLFSTQPKKKCFIQFGPITNYTLQHFRMVEKEVKGSIKAHSHTPI